MKSKFIDVMIIIVIISIVITMTLLIIKYGKKQINEIEVKEVIKYIKAENEYTEQENKFKFDNYDIIGIIKVNKIKIEYPILEEIDSKAMDKSIIKFWGPNLNEYGNLTLAGHSNKDGTMFGKLNQLDKDDLIEIDSLKSVVTYKVFDKYIVTPDNVECMNLVEENTKEITLITCINGNNNRLVVKAREI